METQAQREDSHVETEAEVGIRGSQKPRNGLGLSEAGREQKASLLEDSQTAWSLIPNFELPEL